MNIYTPEDADRYSDIGVLCTTYEFGLAEVSKRVMKIRKKGNYLDFGCGTGRTCELLEKSVPFGSEIIGIDSNISMIEQAKAKYASRGIHFINSDENLPFNDETFDVITSSHVIDEISTSDELSTMILNMVRVLKPDGQLIITMGNPEAKRMGARYKSYRYLNPQATQILYDGDIVNCVFENNGEDMVIQDTFWSTETVIRQLNVAGFKVSLSFPNVYLDDTNDWQDETRIVPDVLFHCIKKTEVIQDL